VFVDEIENGLHYSVMPKIWEGIAKAAREFDCQVIATTHSYECLQSAYDGLSEKYEDDFRYIRIDKIENKTVAKTFDFKLLKVALESNMEVR
jgi:AAA15 family ATPase/GTPase